MRRLALSLAVLGFFLNPGFACSPSDEPDFKYGEPEMKAAVEGTWLLTLRGSDGTVSETTLQIAESGSAQAMLSPTGTGASHRTGFVRSASACGTRTIVKSARACVDESLMPIAIAFVSGSSRFQTASLSGNLSVAGLVFNQGQLELALGDVTAWATVSPSGDTSSIGGGSTDGGRVVALVRTAK